MNSKTPIRTALLRALVLTAVTFGAGIFLYWLMGVTVVSAMLFAVACLIGSVLAAYID